MRTIGIALEQAFRAPSHGGIFTRDLRNAERRGKKKADIQ